jgi:hypothetical protein
MLQVKNSSNESTKKKQHENAKKSRYLDGLLNANLIDVEAKLIEIGTITSKF